MTVYLEDLQDEFHEDGCPLQFRSVIGSGAAGVLQGPGGCDGDSDSACLKPPGTQDGLVYLPCGAPDYPKSDRGPMESVALLSGGSCYAMMGRVPPVVHARCDGGQGATFTVSLIEAIDCPCAGNRFWAVSGVSVSGGRGYKPGATVLLERSVGDQMLILPPRPGFSPQIGFASHVQLLTDNTRTEPELAIEPLGGNGAVFHLGLAPVGWGVSAVSAPAGSVTGSSLQSVTIPGAPLQRKNASIQVNTILESPVLSVSSGWEFEVEERSHADNRKYWTVTSFDISKETPISTGHVIGQSVGLQVVSGYERFPMCATITEVDSDGRPMAVRLDYGGEYWKDTGVFESAIIIDPGVYYSEIKPTISGKWGVHDVPLEWVPVRWGISGVTVIQPGSGYVDGACVRAADNDEDALCDIPFVGSLCCKDGGIQNVVVTEPGSYCRYTGEPTGVYTEPLHRFQAATYFKEDASVAPYVADVHVEVACQFGSQHPTGPKSRGLISATVDSVTSSPSFGQITSLDIIDAADDYLAYRISSIKANRINGRKLVLRATNPVPLIALCVSSSFGSGAAVELLTQDRIELDEGCPCGIVEDGKRVEYVDWDGSPSPLPRINMISGGSGYATRHRVEPSLTVSAKSAESLGYGAEFELHLSEEKEDAAGRPYWEIESVTIKDGEGGSCYGAYGRQMPLRIVPDVRLADVSYNNPFEYFTTQGSDALFIPHLVHMTDTCGGDYWSIESVAVQGGCGYKDGDTLTIRPYAGVTAALDAIAVIHTSSGEECGQVSVDIQYGGMYFSSPSKETLIVKCDTSDDIEDRAAVLQLETAGLGEVVGITVLDGGVYYRETNAGAPYVADVTVTIDQDPISNGSGAQIDAVVDSDVGSATFGQVTAFTLTNPGSEYTLLGSPIDCVYEGGCRFRNDLDGCWSSSIKAPAVQLRFAPGKGPEVRIIHDLGYPLGTQEVIFSSNEQVTDCRSLPESWTLLGQAGQAVVEPGGDWETGGTKCCDASENVSQIVSARDYVTSSVISFAGVSEGGCIQAVNPWEGNENGIAVCPSGGELRLGAEFGSCLRFNFAFYLTATYQVVVYGLECGETEITVIIPECWIREHFEIPGDVEVNDVDLVGTIKIGCDPPACVADNPFP